MSTTDVATRWSNGTDGWPDWAKEILNQHRQTHTRTEDVADAIPSWRYQARLTRLCQLLQAGRIPLSTDLTPKTPQPGGGAGFVQLPDITVTVGTTDGGSVLAVSINVGSVLVRTKQASSSFHELGTPVTPEARLTLLYRTIKTIARTGIISSMPMTAQALVDTVTHHVSVQLVSLLFSQPWATGRFASALPLGVRVLRDGWIEAFDHLDPDPLKVRFSIATRTRTRRPRGRPPGSTITKVLVAPTNFTSDATPTTTPNHWNDPAFQVHLDGFDSTNGNAWNPTLEDPNLVLPTMTASPMMDDMIF